MEWDPPVQPQWLPNLAQEFYQDSQVARKTLFIALRSYSERGKLLQIPNPLESSRRQLVGWLQRRHRHRFVYLKLGPSRSLWVATIRYLYYAFCHASRDPFSSFLIFSFIQHLFKQEFAIIIDFQLAFPRFTEYLLANPFVEHWNLYYLRWANWTEQASSIIHRASGPK